MASSTSTLLFSTSSGKVPNSHLLSCSICTADTENEGGPQMAPSWLCTRVCKQINDNVCIWILGISHLILPWAGGWGRECLNIESNQMFVPATCQMQRIFHKQLIESRIFCMKLTIKRGTFLHHGHLHKKS